jgi:ABC-2 type transport system ATP-binding protein
VNFEVNKGEIVGLLGPNGAGKTTLMQILTSVLLPSAGEGWICGNHIVRDSLSSRRMIGYCSEKSPLYLDMTVKKYLSFVCSLKEVKNRRKRLDRILKECGLESVADRLIGKLSKGFRQRVNLAQALISDPSVLILDEPTVGLDPEQVLEIRSLIKNSSDDRSTLFCTHMLYEAGILCDRLIIIDKGKILAVDSPDRLEDSLGGFYVINLIIEGPEEAVSGKLKEIPEVIEVRTEKTLQDNVTNYLLMTKDTENTVRQVSKLIREQQWEILQIFKEQKTLEEIFHQIVTA